MSGSVLIGADLDDLVHAGELVQRECGCDAATLRCLHIDGVEVLRLYDHSIRNLFSYRHGYKDRYSVVQREPFYRFNGPKIEDAERIYAMCEQRISEGAP